jgi:hypothetical protein
LRLSNYNRYVSEEFTGRIQLKIKERFLRKSIISVTAEIKTKYEIIGTYSSFSHPSNETTSILTWVEPSINDILVNNLSVLDRVDD